MTDAEVIQDDLRAIMVALGISTHARPYSPHEVVQREVLPAIARIAAREREEAIAPLREPLRRLLLALIVVQGSLSKPYPDDARWTPWTRFVQPWFEACSHEYEAIRERAAQQETPT